MFHLPPTGGLTVAELTYARDLYYRASGRTRAWRVVAALLVVTPAAAVAGALYAFLIANVSIVGHITVLVAVALLLVACFAVGSGAVAAAVLRRAGVRSAVAWWAVAAWGALAAWYVSWVVWQYILLRRSGLDVGFFTILASPRGVWEIARLVNREGTLSFGLFGERVYLNGAKLWTLWAFETVIVLGLGSWLPYYMLRRLAFCESCGRWCEYRQGVLSVGYGSGGHGSAADLRARLEQKDLSVLDEYGPADMDAPRRFRIDLQHCPGCPDTHLLSAFLIRVSYGEQGFRKEKARRVVDRLWLDAGQAEEIKRIKDRLWPPIADVAAEPAADDEEGDDVDRADGDDAPDASGRRRTADV